jgi:hypothetical protein
MDKNIPDEAIKAVNAAVLKAGGIKFREDKLRLILSAALPFLSLPTSKPQEASPQLKEFMSGVIGVVEANRFEYMCLWQARGEKTWVSRLSGFAPTIGHIGDAPICLSLFTAIVDGHNLLFAEAVSQVVDYRVVDAWLETNLPASARLADGRLNRTDASNFHNIFPRA